MTMHYYFHQGCIQDSELGGGKLSFLKSYIGGGGNATWEVQYRSTETGGGGGGGGGIIGGNAMYGEGVLYSR